MTELATATPVTLREAIQRTAAQFEAAELCFGHGTDNSWDEAVYLLLTLSGLDDDEAVLDRPLDPVLWSEARAIAARRITERVPLAYLLHRCRYLGLEFHVEPGLVVPRSPLGPLLVEQAEALLPRAPRRVLDLCAGTGCLGIVAGLLFPDCEVTLCELDPRAVAVARLNLREHGLQQRAEVLEGDVRALVATLGQFDLVLCNPPYVNAADMAALPPEFRAEPATGLGAGDDGLAVISPVLEALNHLLSAGGTFLGEVGHSRPALAARHRALPLRWLDEEFEGLDGVFLLQAAALPTR
ncbi:MAG: 50S ribosomal protein L3 N(5)-glutamine methyltransferase [Pseudomonadota bacterium]